MRSRSSASTIWLPSATLLCTGGSHVKHRVGVELEARAEISTRRAANFVAERMEKLKTSICTKVERLFRVIKRQFDFMKVRPRGLAKNTARLVTHECDRIILGQC